MVPDLGPDGKLIKVGKTRRPLYRTQAVAWNDIWRLRECRPLPVCAWVIETSNRKYGEEKVLAALAPYRAFFKHPDRKNASLYAGWTEMFDVSPNVAVSVAVELLGNEAGLVTKTLWSNVDAWCAGGLRNGTFAFTERLNAQRAADEARCDGQN